MEERVGQWWHQALVRVTAPRYAASAVQLAEVQTAVGVLFRATGGEPSLRLTSATAQRTGGRRHWLHRLAGTGERAPLPVLEPLVLALPAAMDVFESPALNRDVYLWLALLAAHMEPMSAQPPAADPTAQWDWIDHNLDATRRALQAYPAFTTHYQALCRAHLDQRPRVQDLPARAGTAERAVQAALQHSLNPQSECPDRSLWPQGPREVAPVWLWLLPSARQAPPTARAGLAPVPSDEHRARQAQDGKRRRGKVAPNDTLRNALVLPFRGEALMSWTEMVRVNRSADDEDDGSATKVADDMDQLSVAGEGQSLAARVKFDLDLPSSSADDLPVGPGLHLPEWDFQRRELRSAHCTVQEMLTRDNTGFVPTPALRQTARQLRRRLEVLRDAPRPQHAQDSGEDIDLDAWVRLQGDAGLVRSDTPAVYTRRVRSERSLATLLLADLSQSTDAYANQQQRVIDVIRDALYVFGEGLNAVGDPFAMWGFSSVRRHQVRLQQLKRFEERWDEGVRTRVGAVRPGYYTRMGAAIRHATGQLGARPERKRLLMLLTDGKPNDLDQYEGRYGLEDTRHAVHQARAAGLTPFCVTIDAAGHEYLPMLFGRQGFCLVRQPRDLVLRLTQAWSLLAR